MRKTTVIKWMALSAWLLAMPAAWTQTDGTEMADAQDVFINTAEIEHDGIEVGEGNEITFNEVPIHDVVRFFARIFSINVIMGDPVEETVTVDLHITEWKPALTAILKTADLMLLESSGGGIYTIVSYKDLNNERLEPGSIFLKYNTVQNVLPVVKGMLVHSNASATAFSAANAIILKETPSRIAMIQDFVEKIDLPRPQVFIEVKFVELNDRAIEDLGIDWQVLEGYTVQAASLTRNFTETRRRFENNAQVTEGIRTRGETSAGSSSAIDSTSNFILPDGTVFDPGAAGGVLVDDLQFVAGPGTTGQNTTQTRSRGNTSGEGTRNIFVQGKNFESVTEDGVVTLTPFPYERTDVRSAILTADDFALTLSALKQMDGVEVVSNPKIVVGSGLTATIHVGINEPNVVALPSGDNGDRFSYQLDPKRPYIEIGVKLEVTPTVNTKSNITVNINPELSRKVGDRIFGEGSTQVSFPITQVRKITTEFNVDSGRTVAIGGLTSTDEVERIKKVPLLGDIPIIGKYLFTHTHTEEIQDEVIIFVTVTTAMADQLERNMGLPEKSELIYRQMMREALEMQKFQNQLVKERVDFDKAMEKQRLKPVEPEEEPFDEIPNFLLSAPEVIELPPLPGAPELRSSAEPVLEEVAPKAAPSEAAPLEELEATEEAFEETETIEAEASDIDLNAPVGRL